MTKTVELKIDMIEPGPSLVEQMEKLHADRQVIFDGLDMMYTHGILDSLDHESYLVQASSMIRVKLRQLVNQNESQREAAKNPDRSLDSTWPNQQAGYDAIDSQLSGLSGGDKK